MKRNSFIFLLILMVQACAHQPVPQPVVAPRLEAVPYIVREPPGTGPDEIWKFLPRQTAEVVIAASGDVLMHGRVKQSAHQNNRVDEQGASINNSGYNFLFEYLKPLVEDAGWALVNLETPTAPKHGSEGKPFIFNAPEAVLEGLVWAGVDMVSIANNHAFDQGILGLAETVELARKHGLITLGAGRDASESGELFIREISTIRVGFLGYTQLLNIDLNVEDEGKPRINVLARERVLSDIRSARPQVDFLVLSVHWGVEYTDQPRQQEIDLAHACFEAGADVIIGHHPHVLQPLEVYQTSDNRTCLVAYSLGNLISNQSRMYQHGITPEAIGKTRDGTVLKIRIAKIDYGSGVERIELRGVGFTPLYTENRLIPDRTGEGVSVAIQPVPNDLRIEQILIDLKELQQQYAETDPNDPEYISEMIRLKKELALYVDRKNDILRVLGDQFYTPYFIRN